MIKMPNEQLTELIRDEQNRLLRKDTRQEVTAIPLGVPVPFSIQMNDYVPAHIAPFLKKNYQQIFGGSILCDTLTEGNVDEANAFVGAVSSGAIAPSDMHYVPIRDGKSVKEVFKHPAAIQFYKV